MKFSILVIDHDALSANKAKYKTEVGQAVSPALAVEMGLAIAKMHAGENKAVEIRFGSKKQSKDLGRCYTQGMKELGGAEWQEREFRKAVITNHKEEVKFRAACTRRTKFLNGFRPGLSLDYKHWKRVQDLSWDDQQLSEAIKAEKWDEATARFAELGFLPIKQGAALPVAA